jgi:hypothetical protein
VAGHQASTWTSGDPELGCRAVTCASTAAEISRSWSRTKRSVLGRASSPLASPAVDELGGGTSDDRQARQPGADASIPELVGHAIGRHLTSVRITGGLALTIASVGMLGLFLWAAVVPYHYERSTPPIGEVCFTNGRTATTVGCFEVDQDALDQSFEDDMNHSNRVIGIFGALTSCTALVLGWRAWRSPWRQRTRAGRRVRLVLAAACVSPVAALSIGVAVAGLSWTYSSAFE